MSNTSNFDFCAELSIGAVKQIFHLAFKNESAVLSAQHRPASPETWEAG